MTQSSGAQNIARRLYGWGWRLATPLLGSYLLYRSLWQPEYRQHWDERFGYWRTPSNTPDTHSYHTGQVRPLWVHAVSVGETAAVLPLLRRLGATAAGSLLELRSQTEVLVAGVRVSTMTPPMRGGNRVVFISLDDGTGTADCAFFDEAQRLSGPVLFGTRLLLVRGTTRRTGPRGISITALQAWALTRPDLEQQVAAARERSEKRGGSEPGRPRRRVG